MLAALLTGALHLSPIPQVSDWHVVLAPPFEPVAVSSLSYVPDPAGQDMHFRPRMTAMRGGGDCEDLAIATYHNMRLAGVAADNLFVLIGMLPTGDWHAVVAVNRSNGWQIIDPSGRPRGEAIRPLYMVNENDTYLVRQQ